MDSASDEDNLTDLLVAWRGGNEEAGEHAFSKVYLELRRLADLQLRGRPQGTLGTTALVNETFLKLSRASAVSLQDRNHFFCLAARAMRQIVVDHARQFHTSKRGGGVKPLPLEPDLIAIKDSAAELLELDQALEQLAQKDVDLARLVELRFFAGLTVEETANAVEKSQRTVKRQWRVARAFLYEKLSSERKASAS